MASIPQLGTLSPSDREEYLWEVFQECEDFRFTKEAKILEVFEFVRGLKDEGSRFKAKLRHPYAFAAAESIKSRIYPILFSADPVVQIIDPNSDNYDRNQISERIITSFLKNPLRTNFRIAWDRILNDAIWFGFSFPWTYFRSRMSVIGPRWVPTGRTYGDGTPELEEEYRKIRTYHAPWLEHVDVWDSFIHADGLRGFTRRDVTGYELLAQSTSANPIYKRDLVMLMIRREVSKRQRKANQEPNFSDGSSSFRERDYLAMQVGAEPPRHSEIEVSKWEKDILAKPFVILHYDDGEYSGSYAVASDNTGLMELRFFAGTNYDGTSNRLRVPMFQSPEEVYGTGIMEIALPLLKLHTRFYQAAADGAALTVHPMWHASQMQRTMGSEIISGPGAIIWSPNTASGNLEEHVRRLDMPQSWVNAVQMVDTIQNALDMVFAIDDPQRGQFPGGRKTAYENQLVQQGAQGRIEVLNDKITNHFAVPLIRKWLAMATEHYQQRDYVEMLGMEGVNYIPPSITELVTGLQYVPKGSLTLADSQLRQSRWPAVAGLTLQLLPYAGVPHINELYKRIMEDMGAENVSRLIPDMKNPQLSSYLATVMSAMQLAGGGMGEQPGIATQPKSPGDISGMLREAGGERAPPGPAMPAAGGGMSGGFGGNGSF